MAGDPRPGGTRREEYAEATRQAILEAARRLFRERGYFATKVDEIAAMARVAPATVYAVDGIDLNAPAGITVALVGDTCFG